MSFKKYKFKFYLNARHIMSGDKFTDTEHTHTWQITLNVKNQNTELILFKEIEDIIDNYLKKYEGQLLNEVDPFNIIEPYNENISEVFYLYINKLLKEKKCTLTSLELSENPSRSYIIENHENNDYHIDLNILSQNTINTSRDSKINSLIAKMERTLKQVSSTTDKNNSQDEEKEELCNEKSSLLYNKKISLMNKLKSNIVPLIIITLTSILTVFFIIRKGVYPWGADTWGHLFKSQFLYEKFLNGDLYPLYMEHWYNGLQPFRYWAPLPYYVILFFQLITGGNILLSYYLFIIFIFVAGGMGWVVFGNALNRRNLGILLGILWFFIPDNLRVLFGEGNLPRVLATVIFPYILYGVWDYINNKSKKGMIIVFVSMIMSTLTHLMVTAFLGITIFLYVLTYSLFNKKIRECIQILVVAVLGIAFVGIWVYPALKGGMMDLNQSSVREVMKSLTYPIKQSLNPFFREKHSIDLFYFGLSPIIISVIGLLFSNRKSKISFVLTILIFMGTTKFLLPFLIKLPMSQLFWMMRFTPLAMAIFFIGLLLWKNLRRKILIIFIILIFIDGIHTLNIVGFALDKPQLSRELDMAVDISDSRIGMLDLSIVGSYPSHYITYNKQNKKINQVFGWSWQGAKTANNIVWINTAFENGYYQFVFDRFLELGADTLLVKRDLIKNEDIFLNEANKIGYAKKNQTNNTLILKYPVNHRFGTKVKYDGLGIGQYSSNIGYIFPGFEIGKSNYIDDYDIRRLSKYKVIYLSGFNYRNINRAEEIVRTLSKKGIKIVIDMTNVKVDLNVSRSKFLDVVAQPVKFKDKFPVLNMKNEDISLTDIPDEYENWNTIYLENLDNVEGKALLNHQIINFLGSKENKNITFIGFNIPFFAVDTKDGNAIKILEAIMELDAYKAPDRKIVQIDVIKTQDIIEVQSEEPDVVIDIASLDSFKKIEGSYSKTHNLVTIKDKSIKIRVFSPYILEGTILTFIGWFGFLGIYIAIFKKNFFRKLYKKVGIESDK